ncbi:GspH/FimT family pseudopilin [Dyella sp. 20L07]|uniref:GspH/FimT family pseudopilin n=1 Tax=Dyella sp. 20L07 TaxID=3384240 RepID=UPI003D2B46BB
MKRGGQMGFSLIELMITLAILAILIVLGAPSYQQWIRNVHTRTAAESLQNGLRLARSEAAQRGANVRFELTSATDPSWTVCVLGAATTCATAETTSTSNNIQTFVAAGGAGKVTLNVATAVGSLSTQLTGGVPSTSGITFNAMGRPTAFGTTSLARIDATSGQAGDRWLVTTISSGGMVRMCDPQLALASDPQGCQ